MKDQFKKIRKSCFSRKMQIDYDLINMVKAHKSHRFLFRPASQLCCNYLVNYVKELSECHFSMPINKLNVLDWGCGKGWVSYFLKKAGAEPFCCDIKVNKADSAFGQNVPIIASTGINVRPLEHEYVLPYDSDSMNAVLSFGVLEHVSDDKRSLEEIHRILKPGGLFFCFNLPYKFSWIQHALHLKGNFYHDRLYSANAVKALMSESGFEIADVWYRQLYPRSLVTIKEYHLLELIDQFLTTYTPFKFISTYIEFVSEKK
jgi:SAM-dependent methyltransferase